MNLQRALTGDKKGISAFALRIAGFVFTFIDCLYMAGLGRNWMSGLRWAAFPIFAFLLAEGFEKTSSRELYFRRLFVFTAVAEVPYDLMYFAQPVRLQSQSVMLTLLTGFAVIWLIDFINRKLDNLVVTLLAMIALTAAGTYAARMLNAGFYKYGIMIIVLFYICNHFPYRKVPQLLFFLYFGLISSTETAFMLSFGGLMYEIPKEVFSLLALAFIWLYNGERGPNGIAYRLGYYLVYPLMMLAVTLLRILVF